MPIYGCTRPCDQVQTSGGGADEIGIIRPVRPKLLPTDAIVREGGLHDTTSRKVSGRTAGTLRAWFQGRAGSSGLFILAGEAKGLAAGEPEQLARRIGGGGQRTH